MIERPTGETSWKLKWLQKTSPAICGKKTSHNMISVQELKKR